jgi:hypothetical protein
MSIEKSLEKRGTKQFANNLNEHFRSQSNLSGALRFSRSRCVKKIRLYVVKPLILLIVVWNLMFIPVQQSFKFPIEGVFLILECITIVTYGGEILYRCLKLKNFSRI